jgi:hypothetical protein
MSSYFVLYTQASGAILAATRAATSPYTPGTGEAILACPATDTDAAQAVQFPAWYLVQNGALTLQAYWVVSTTSTSGTATITATLNHPPASPPTTATLTVAGSTYGAAVSTDTAQWTLTIDPTIAGQAVPFIVSATGTVSATTAIGGGPARVGQQSWTASDGSIAVGPGGAESLAYVLGYEAGAISQAEIINALGSSVAELFHLVHAKVLPALQAATYTPLTLTADEQAALTVITTDLLPGIVPTLGAVQAGDTTMPVWAQMLATFSAVQSAFTGANAALDRIPGLS